MTDKPISRRSVTQGLILGGIAAPMLIRPERADATTNGSSLIDPVGGFLRLNGVLITLVVLLIITNSTSSGVTTIQAARTRRGMPQKPIDRSSGGLLSGINSAPIRKRFAGAQAVGQFHQLGQTVAVVPASQNATAGLKSLVIANEKVEISPSGGLRQLQVKQNLTYAQFARGKRVGTLHRLGDDGLAAFPPHDDLGIA